MNKARITYRFNENGQREKDSSGKGEPSKVIPLYEEEFRVVEEKKESRPEKNAVEPELYDDRRLNHFTADFGGWSSPYDAETQRIEDLIRQSKGNRGRDETDHAEYTDHPGRPSFSEENRYDAQTGYFDAGADYTAGRESRWDGPEVVGSRYVRHSRTSWVKIFVSVAGAAVTGVLLGFLVLSMFSGGDSTANLKTTAGNDKPSGAQDAKQAPTGSQTGDKPADQSSGTASVPAVAGTEAAAAIPSRTYVLLQHGSFAAKQGADQDQAELRKIGLPAVSELTDNKYNVYVGLVSDRDHALSLGQKLKNDKVETYAKQLSLPAVSKVRWNGNPESLKGYLDQSEQLVQTLSKLSVLHLEEAKPTSIDDPTLQAVKTAHTAWTQSAQAIAQGSGDAVEPLLQKMNNALNSAKTSVDEYKKNPSPEGLWQTQSFLLQFVLAEKELLSKIAVNS